MPRLRFLRHGLATLPIAWSLGLAAAQEPGPSPGTAFPINRALAAKLTDAEAFLASGRLEDGLVLLQEVAEADPAALIPTADGDRFAGAAAQAMERLAGLPSAWQALRQKIYGTRAEEELLAALNPPDLARLEALARTYSGLETGARARLAAAELWLDRGQREQAEALDVQGRLPPWSDAGWLPAEAEAAQRLPAVQDLEDPRLPFLDTTQLQPLWSRQFEDRSRGGLLVQHRLAIGGGIVYACDGYEVLALEAGSGREIWRYVADPRWSQMESMDRLRDAISPHQLTAPVLSEGVLLAVVHEAEPLGRSDSYMRIPIRRFMPARRLVALDASDGRLLWKVSTSWALGQREPREIAAGPPAARAGRVFLPVYDAVGTIDFSLMALELKTGRFLWRRFLTSGQLESNLFGNVLIELATPPPLAETDRVLVCSHLGSFHALDAATGEILWTRAYPRLEVRPTETGQIAKRPQWLGRNLGASDGQRVAWAPVDADAIFLLGAQDGELLGSWPAVDESNRHLFNLLGLQADGVWAFGSRLALLRVPPLASRHSDALHEEGRQLLAARGGALTQGAVLLPRLYEAVDRFTPDRLTNGGRVLDFEGSYQDSGSLQAAPCLLFVERPDGISAFGSLRSITAIMRSARLDLATLTEVLPVALNLDFGAIPDDARKLAESAVSLAEQPAFARQSSSLRLLAARSWLQAGDLKQAEPQLLRLLAGPEVAVSEAACGLLLDDPFLLQPLQLGVERAMEVAESWSDRRLPLHGGSSASSAMLVARARALRAIAGDRHFAARRSLTDLLLLSASVDLTVSGQPIHDWAAASLRLLLREAGEREAYESDSRSALARLGCSAEYLRAFGETAAAQEALGQEVARADLPRAQRLIRARWRREHGQSNRNWPDLERWFPPARELPRAPRTLTESGARRAPYGSPLLVRADASAAALVWVPTKTGIQLLSFPAAGPALERQAYPLPGRRLGGMETVVATEEGCALVFRDRILHFREDGSIGDVPFPAALADNAQALALGDGLVAAVLNAQPGFLRLTVFDASTGTSYLEEDLPGHPDRRIELRQEGRWLFVLEADSALAYRIDLHFDTPPLAFSLAAPMNVVDLPTATVAGGTVHYLLNRNKPSVGTVASAGPGLTPTQTPFEGFFVKRVRVGPGLAWTLQAPTRAARTEEQSLYWLDPGTSAPRQIGLGSPDARILQLVESEYKRSTDPVPTEALVLTQAADGSTVVKSFRSGADGPVWICAAPDLPFRDLQSNQPAPRQAADAWALPLLLRATASTGPRLELLLIESDGRLRARATAEWAGNVVDQVRIDLLPGALLLRNGDTLTRYGESP